MLYAAQHALEPFDDRQADERAAVATALLVKAFTGEWVDPGSLFRSLEPTPADRAAAAAEKKKNLGRGFYLWARHQLAAQAAQIDARGRKSN